jgi:hypothetical protein
MCIHVYIPLLGLIALPSVLCTHIQMYDSHAERRTTACRTIERRNAQRRTTKRRTTERRTNECGTTERRMLYWTGRRK